MSPVHRSLSVSASAVIAAAAAAAAFFKRCTLSWPRCRRSFQALPFFFTTPIELGARLLFAIRRRLLFFSPYRFPYDRWSFPNYRSLL
jgi:hypothetical protein